MSSVTLEKQSLVLLQQCVLGILPIYSFNLYYFLLKMAVWMCHSRDAHSSTSASLFLVKLLMRDFAPVLVYSGKCPATLLPMRHELSVCNYSHCSVLLQSNYLLTCKLLLQVSYLENKSMYRFDCSTSLTQVLHLVVLLPSQYVYSRMRGFAVCSLNSQGTQFIALRTDILCKENLDY